MLLGIQRIRTFRWLIAAVWLLSALAPLSVQANGDCASFERQYPQDRGIGVIELVLQRTTVCTDGGQFSTYEVIGYAPLPQNPVVITSAPPVIHVPAPAPVFVHLPPPAPVGVAVVPSGGPVGRFGSRFVINGAVKTLPVQPGEHCVGYDDSGIPGGHTINISGDDAWWGYIDAVQVNWNGRDLFSEPSLLEIRFPFSGTLTFSNGAYCFVPREWAGWARAHRYEVLQRFTRPNPPIISIP